MNRNVEYNYKNKMRRFGLVQICILLISFGFYVFSTNSITKFYTFLVITTVFILILLQILHQFVKELFNRKSLKDKRILLLKILVVIVALAAFSYNSIKYYKDVPYAVNSKYSVIVDECTYYYVNKGKDSHLDITVGGIDFNVSLKYERFIKRGEIYKIEYLPNTKEVLNIYGKK